MDNIDRLESLLTGKIELMSVPDYSDFHQFAIYGEHCRKQCEQLDPEIAERSTLLFWGALADRLQDAAQSRYGNTSESSTRKVMAEYLEEMDGEDDWQEMWKSAQSVFADVGLSQEQVDLIHGDVMQWLENVYADGVRPWELLPREMAPETVDILTQMFKEVACVDG